MSSELTIEPEQAPARRMVPRAVRAHPFIALLLAGALVGGGIRFVPTSSAGAAAANGQTACAAK